MDKYKENELGKVPSSTKNAKLSEETEKTLLGLYDGELADPETQPVIYRTQLKIKAKNMLNWSEISRTLSGDRETIRSNRIPKIHQEDIDKIIDFLVEWQKSVLK